MQESSNTKQPGMQEHSRINKALGILIRFGGISESHHQAWVIDQTMRALMGDDGYARWVQDCGADGYDVDVGVAP